MVRFAWIDGRTVDVRQMPDARPYVVERIHTLDYRAQRMERHLDVLRTSAGELFGFAPLCRARDMERIVAELLAHNGMTRTLSCPVRVKLSSRAELMVECEPPTFGSGCYLRAKMPVAAALSYDAPPWECRSSMTEEIVAVADRMVHMQGADAAIRVDSQNMVAGWAWSPLFLVRDRHLFTPREYASAEYGLAVEAASRAGLQVHARPFSVRALDYADEIFSVDSMGMTAYSRIGKRLLSSTIAARMASCFE
ncbi:MAG: aminotransferase class IV [Alistipes sp.]|nr:aminotransferase class IV [Alistipes sp.]MDE7129055.1 aminotransferase class IV [Alistipes sp.]